MHRANLTSKRPVWFAAVAVVLVGAAMAAAQQDKPDASKVIADWPDVAKQAAQQMIEKYGQPDGVTAHRLDWQKKGPWKAIIVSRDPVDHDFPKPHQDVLEQVIDYQVPVEKFDDLAAYDGSVIAERTKGTMAARCDKEPMNFLALNLAHDIITDAKSVEEARAFYAEAVKAFMAGEKHPYTQELQFEPPGEAGDPDKAVLKE